MEVRSFSNRSLLLKQRTRRVYFVTLRRLHTYLLSLTIDIVTVHCTFIKLFQNRPDKHWLQQDIKYYNWESELSGIGSRGYMCLLVKLFEFLFKFFLYF